MLENLHLKLIQFFAVLFLGWQESHNFRVTKSNSFSWVHDNAKSSLRFWESDGLVFKCCNPFLSRIYRPALLWLNGQRTSQHIFSNKNQREIWNSNGSRKKEREIFIDAELLIGIHLNTQLYISLNKFIGIGLPWVSLICFVLSCNF